MGEFSSPLFIVYTTRERRSVSAILSFYPIKVIKSLFLKLNDLNVVFNFVWKYSTKESYNFEQTAAWKKSYAVMRTQTVDFFSTSTQSLLNKDKNMFSTESFQHQSADFMAMLLTNATPVSQRAVCVIWNTGTFSKNHLPKKIILYYKE